VRQVVLVMLSTCYKYLSFSVAVSDIKHIVLHSCHVGLRLVIKSPQSKAYCLGVYNGWLTNAVSGLDAT